MSNIILTQIPAQATFKLEMARASSFAARPARS